MRVFILFTLLWATSSFAQNSSTGIYPKGYFIKPLDIPASLAGNFGELRPNHYHMGLDFRTNRMENLPVHAAADGYVARVKVEPFGYGRAVYIYHPTGLTTVYAHLNTFFPALEAYVKEQQYKLESWNVYLDIPPDLFPVKKGDLIAYSGNTGGSQGPHLHFEIRDTEKDANLNPLLFGLPVADNVPPVIQRLAIYDRNRSTYEQTPKMIALKKMPTGYVTAPAIIPVSSDKISFAVSAYDSQSGSPNHNGIFQGILYQDKKETIRFVMDTIHYDNTRYMNAHIDYKTKANGGPYLQHLSELSGYVNSIYKKKGGSGVLSLKEGVIHEIKVEIKDAAGNTSVLNCKVQYKPAAKTYPALPGKMFYPFMVNVGEGGEDCEYYIGEKGLYDSVRINYKRFEQANPKVVSATHKIGAAYIPLQEALVVHIKPDSTLDPGKADRVVMQRFEGNKKEIKKVQWQNGWAVARFLSFGNFQLVLDEEPPKIIPVNFKDGQDVSKLSQLVFNVTDDMGSVRNVRTELDGKWLRFTNDKAKSFLYRFDEHCPPGNHELKISASDEAGNVTEEIFTFTR